MMIEMVIVEEQNDKAHQWYECRAENRKDLRWRCGACMRGFVKPSVGEKCSRCGATVKNVRYDSFTSASDVF